jgi:hypothetical protein
MLPAEKMFQDIAAVVQTPIVRVANARDIYEHRFPSVFGKPSNEGNLKSTYKLLKNF